MKKQIRSLGVLAALLFSAAASANVSTFPSYHDFGSVPSGRSDSTTIRFFNNSARPVLFFNVSCHGDLSVFSCFSMCSFLPGFGSCSVQVEFTPRNGDDLRKMVWLNGFGDGNFATATVYGTDQKAGR